ncbi:MAG: phosphoglycerate kinase, partial [Candidatus Sungbacteria bacterium]|nr:phosphoglycerate kinase [Candidatus Sungbacteria bacterium]
QKKEPNIGIPVVSSAIVMGKRVLVRADFDVAVAGGRVIEDFRIRRVLPTLKSLIAAGAAVRIIAHRGRPNGMRSEALGMAPVAETLGFLLGRAVTLIDNPFASDAEERCGGAGSVTLFENIRFWDGEEKNDLTFARELAVRGDLYVNEAFANCHRAHASIVSLPRMLPAYAGLALADEIRQLSRVRERPAHPFVAILGGAKLETKLPLARRLLRDADQVLIGGVLANTLLTARGVMTGISRRDEECMDDACSIARDKKIFLPVDVVVTKSSLPTEGDLARIVDLGMVEDGDAIIDIGPASEAAYERILSGARTIVWNGPLGLAEVSAGTHATRMLGAAISRMTGAFRVLGGGDTITALSSVGLLGGFDHVSAGGGAMLSFLAGENLPGIKALLHNDK